MTQSLERRPDNDDTTTQDSAVVFEDEGMIPTGPNLTAVRPTLCPRCDTKLINPDGLGWCSKCGYCHTLEEEGKNLPDPAPKPAVAVEPSPLGAKEFGLVLRKMPSWTWVMIAGLCAVVGLSFVANELLPEVCVQRALWSALQMVLGFGGLVAIQLWAILRYGSEDDSLGMKDIVLPGRVWRVVIRRLPASRGAVWAGSWCLGGILCGAFLIGGFEYWLEILKEGKLRRMAADLDRAAEVVPKKDDEGKGEEKPAPTLPTTPGRSEAQCAVIGYQTDASGNLTGLIVATSRGNKLQYSGAVREGLTPRQCRELKESLSRLGRTEPLIPGLKMKGVHWVKPGVFCDVTHSGADKQGELQEAKFKEVRD